VETSRPELRGDSEFPGVQPADEPSNFAEGEAKEVGPMLAHLASRLDDLRAAPEHWPIKVRLQDGTEKEVHAEDFDVEFIREWGKLVGTPKSEFTFKGVGITFAITADQDAFAERRASLAAFEKNQFHLLWAGKETGLDVGKSKKLGEWMDRMNELCSARSGKKSQKNPDSSEGTDGVKVSTRKTDLDWSILLTPHLVASPAIEGPIQSATLPCAGSPQPLEWWHHDNKVMKGKDWGNLAVEIGYSADVITAENKAASTIENGMCQRGLGFPRERVEHSRKISPIPPENLSDIPEGG